MKKIFYALACTLLLTSCLSTNGLGLLGSNGSTGLFGNNGGTSQGLQIDLLSILKEVFLKDYSTDLGNNLYSFLLNQKSTMSDALDSNMAKNLITAVYTEKKEMLNNELNETLKKLDKTQEINEVKKQCAEEQKRLDGELFQLLERVDKTQDFK
jgi:hypothetical protein